MKKRIVEFAVCASIIVGAILSAVLAPSVLYASQVDDLSVQSDQDVDGEISRRANFETVLDWYETYTGFLDGIPVNELELRRGYKQLRFQNSFAWVRDELTNVYYLTKDDSHYVEGFGIFALGRAETWTCVYETW